MNGMSNQEMSSVLLMTRKEYTNDQEQPAQYPRDDRDASSCAAYVGKRSKNEPVKWYECD